MNIHLLLDWHLSLSTQATECTSTSAFKFNVFHVRAPYYTKTLITNKCTKRVLSSIVTHSYIFRPCRVIFRENFFVIVTPRLHFIVEWECAVDCVLRCFWRRALSARVHAASTQYTVNSTFSLNYKVQPWCNDNKKVLPEDDPAGSKYVGVCYDWW
jgi:hypothetical protein